MTTDTAATALLDEMATAASITVDEAADYLLRLDETKAGELGTMTADLTVRNIVAGMAPAAAFEAAHRRVGRETGLALRKALDAQILEAGYATEDAHLDDLEA
jgi:hypothetical protein